MDIFFQPSTPCLSSSFCISMSSTFFLFLSPYWLFTCPITSAPAAWSPFIPLLMVGITLRNTATRQPRVFPLLLLDKGLSLMPLGPLGKPGSSILMLYHPSLWLSQWDDVIVERRVVMEAQKICLCEDALQMSSCSAHTDAGILWNTMGKGFWKWENFTISLREVRADQYGQSLTSCIYHFVISADFLGQIQFW